MSSETIDAPLGTPHPDASPEEVTGAEPPAPAKHEEPVVVPPYSGSGDDLRGADSDRRRCRYREGPRPVPHAWPAPAAPPRSLPQGRRRGAASPLARQSFRSTWSVDSSIREAPPARWLIGYLGKPHRAYQSNG